MDLIQQARAFAALHAGQDTRAYIRNLQADVQMLKVGAFLLPVTIASAIRNAWVVSPHTTYASYACEESERLAPSWARKPLRALTGWAAERMRATGLDCAVSVNNWLISTNIYPDLDGCMVQDIRDQCLARWPTQAIWLRSLNRVQHEPWLKALDAAGFLLIPTRQVYLFEHLKSNRRSGLRRDLALMSKTTLNEVRHEEFQPNDFKRSERLYAQLYLEKYSSLNPAYTAELLRAWHKAGLLHMRGWRDANGILQGVVGVFSQGAVLTAPIVGYNTDLPQSLGLYRLIMAQVFQTSMGGTAVLNLSAGAGSFKRLRGGEPVIEYSAVYANHLAAPARRLLWLLHAITSGIGVPLMRWKKL